MFQKQEKWAKLGWLDNRVRTDSSWSAVVGIQGRNSGELKLPKKFMLVLASVCCVVGAAGPEVRGPMLNSSLAERPDGRRVSIRTGPRCTFDPVWFLLITWMAGRVRAIYLGTPGTRMHY